MITKLQNLIAKVESQYKSLWIAYKQQENVLCLSVRHTKWWFFAMLPEIHKTNYIANMNQVFTELILVCWFCIACDSNKLLKVL